MLDTFSVVGRAHESLLIEACLKASRNILLEGPVGVGKTHLALAAASRLGQPIFRIDGDSRYTEQKLTGWFDPPAVLKKGYSAETFIPGPLASAMKEGGVLFINELNRLPEGVQNVLLPAIDERLIQIPYLGALKAKPEFRVIATQNPKEFVATSHLSEAILDRFELVVLEYQSLEEEKQIVSAQAKASAQAIDWAVRLARLTREDERVRRGASVRAALSVVNIFDSLVSAKMEAKQAFHAAALAALPNRIELDRESFSDRGLNQETNQLVAEWVEQVWAGADTSSQKLKKKP